MSFELILDLSTIRNTVCLFAYLKPPVYNIYVYVITGIFVPNMIVYSIPIMLNLLGILGREMIIENQIPLVSNTKRVVAISFLLVRSVLFLYTSFFVFFANFFFDREENEHRYLSYFFL